MGKNKTYAVSRRGEFWSVIDCGPTKEGGMATGEFWMTHFKKDGRTYRWYRKLFNPPPDLNEWQEINIVDRTITVIDEVGNNFEGWDDADNLCFQTLSNFANLIGKPMSIEDVKKAIEAT